MNALELVQEAQDKIYEAIGMLERASEMTGDDSHCRAVIAHLICSAGENHHYVDNSDNLDGWMRELKEAER